MSSRWVWTDAAVQAVQEQVRTLRNGFLTKALEFCSEQHVFSTGRCTVSTHLSDPEETSR